MNNKGDKDMDKEKLKKAGLLTIAFFVLLTVVIFVVSKINHKAFEFLFLRFLIAAVICAFVAVYVPRIWR